MRQTVSAVLVLSTVALAQGPSVQRSAIALDTVKRGDIVRMTRGLGVLTSTRTAEIQLPDVQARQIEAGQTAAIDTRHGIVIGRVARKDAAVAGIVNVELQLNGDAPAGANPGMAVDGTFHLLTMKNAVYVARPDGAESGRSGTIFVLEPDGQHAVKRHVEFGLAAFAAARSGGGQPSEPVIQILSGLQAGDKVILSDMSAFKDADRVRLQ